MRTLRLAGVSAVLMSALVLAGCSGQPEGKVASLGGDKDKAAAQNDADVPKDPKERALKFAKCMRDNGVDMPDPTFGEGGASIALGSGDADMEKFKKANKACEKYSGAKDFNPNDPKVKEEQLKWAKCMREQGIDMPDPGADGSVRAMPMDKDQKKMEEAFKKCSPDGKGGVIAVRPEAGK
ncbi:hypothetical protein [Allokutzneria albata]|uniref:Lipoprotein n=1 Tax=Allokutzneria albata TaxID=211114 RepID=A0A1H0BT94_ALLAB|nr:hypothetical protein [Allokutzneria albata]SDN48796.1 hypothetical protein SAMN04489726_6827 [Allokutzneria albata]